MTIFSFSINYDPDLDYIRVDFDVTYSTINSLSISFSIVFLYNAQTLNAIQSYITNKAKDFSSD
jgi:hypothetical protein